jgi:Methyltransferase domain
LSVASNFTRNALDLMSKDYPSAQNAANLFKGSWFSKLPDVNGRAIASGPAGLFSDQKVIWGASQSGGLEGKSVLELGPLEGGHSFLMSSLGARRVLAVESNSRAYMKCLITKEIYSLDRCKFMLGDFNKFMAETNEKFDFCLASGVLYHMTNPPELLSLISRVTDVVMFWTQYFDEQVIRERMPLLKRLRFAKPRRDSYQGFAYTRHDRRYGIRLRNLQFIGGTAANSCWMELDDIIAGLKFFGFKRVEIHGNEKEHVNGPAVCLLGSKN